MELLSLGGELRAGLSSFVHCRLQRVEARLCLSSSCRLQRVDARHYQLVVQPMKAIRGSGLRPGASLRPNTPTARPAHLG